MSRRWSILPAVAMVFIMVIPVNAGWVMLELDGNSTMISNGRLKGMSGEASWIFYGPKNEMIFIKDNQRTFYRGTVDDYCTSTTAIFEKMLKDMPEEQRKKMAKENEPSAHKVAVVKTDDDLTIAGFKTVKYRVLVDDKLFEEVWLTTDAGLMNDYKLLIPMLQKFNSCVSSMKIGFTPEKSSDYQKLLEMGFQLKSVKYEAGIPKPVTDVVKLEKTDVPDTEFEVPSGYQQRFIAEMMQSQME